MKRCPSCEQEKPFDDYYLRGGGRIGVQSFCKSCSRVAGTQGMRKWREDNPGKDASIARDRRKQHRHELLEAYGGAHPACVCCGEDSPMFLALDHIDNNGSQQRREMGFKSVPDFHNWLRANNYPPGYQILCHNCNMGKHLNKGTCPHQSVLQEMIQ